MKHKLILLCLLSFFIKSNAQNITFKDIKFKEALLNSKKHRVDTNSDGEISFQEAEALKAFTFENVSLTEMTDIKYFKNLEVLKSNNVVFPSLDLSNNVHIKQLELWGTTISSIDVSMLSNLKKLILSAVHLNQLDLGSNSKLEHLELINTKIPTLDLSNKTQLELVKIRSNNRALSDIDFSNANKLKTLEIHYGSLTNIDLKDSPLLQILKLSNNAITALDLSKNTELLVVDITNTNLTALDLSKNNELRQLTLAFNKLASINVTNCKKLSTISISNNELTTIDLTTNTDLQQLLIDSNKLTNVDFSKNTKLQFLRIMNNKLTALDVRNCKLDFLYFAGNPDLKKAYLTGQPLGGDFENTYYEHCLNLEYMCIDSKFVKSAKERKKSTNHSNYVVSNDCSKSNILKGIVNFDLDKNGCDANDRGFSSGLKFGISSLTGGYEEVFPDEDGVYQIALADGDYYMFPVFAKPTNFDISPAPSFPPTPISFPTEGPIKIKDFCVTSLVDFNDLEVTIIPDGAPARPGFNASYSITYKNRGTTTQSGNIALDYAENILSLVSATPAVETTTTNQFSWSFNNLKPYESRQIKVTLNVNKPTDTPAVNDGDILKYTVKVNGATDEAPEDNTMVLNQTVVNSYDPNDKTCLEGTILEPKEVGNYLHYLIRFENKGTADAVNITVVDEIDTTKLDIETFEPLYASHKYRTTVKDKKEITFTFEDINLPFDDANNDGYVLFRIKTKDDLVVGDVIDNKAAIYFDFNPPIITNVESVEVKEKKVEEPTFDDYFTLSPNPTTGILNLTQKKTAIQIQYISIHDLSGRVVGFFPGQMSVFNVGYLFPNLYVLKVHTSDKGILTTKFMKVTN
ncbi:T9SS type A sorting domain-containing protein [Tenacibaculum sp. 190524A02b]|uniref:DUF7619 domain-containing protein n=1 Tax=Tenacibaculum vairaonense TaxID=3137860 RepID=UPI0031FAE29D